MKNARGILSEHIKVHYDEEEKITKAMKTYAKEAVDTFVKMYLVDANIDLNTVEQFKNTLV